MFSGAAEVGVRAEVKGFAARQFREALASSLPGLQFLVLLPLPSDLELVFALGVRADVPLPCLPCYFVGVGSFDFSGAVRTLGFINNVG